MTMGEDTVIPSLDHLPLRRIADALEALLDLKQKELAGEIQPHYAKAKDPARWIACRKELVRLLEFSPYLEWEMEAVKNDSIFREADSGNIYRPNQWRRFLSQHAIPNKPDDGSGIIIIGLDKP